MRLAIAAIFAALVAYPAPAREPAKPAAAKDVSARDVAATPVTDLNLRKGEIPPVLVAAEQEAYSLRGLTSCQQIAAAIGELDAVLGDDVDLPQTGERRIAGGRLAQSVVGSFIPFRGVIREMSGASSRDREVQAAILSGVARRAFLKGTGQARGCRYPARAATAEVFNRRMAELNAEQRGSKADGHK
jgi:hypothetical protein